MAESGDKPEGVIQITIKVVGSGPTKMKAKTSAKFGKIFDAVRIQLAPTQLTYARRTQAHACTPNFPPSAQYLKSKGLSSDAIVFHFEGEKVDRDDTPEKLGIEDGAEIEGIIAQTGGC